MKDENVEVGRRTFTQRRRTSPASIVKDSGSVYSTTLGEFLRARRDARQPEEAGIQPTLGRRVHGLRRDEVARLAGMNRDYYMRLEQGRITTPSRQILDAIARALDLDAVATEYLYRLGGLGGPRPSSVARDSELLESVLRRWRSTPAYLADENLDVVAANDLMTAITNGAIHAGMNAAELTFAPHARTQLHDWERAARQTVGALRLQGDPRSHRFQALLATLEKDPDFRRLWALHEVSVTANSELRANVEGFGEVHLTLQNFTVADLPGYTVTTYTAEQHAPTMRLLASLVSPCIAGG